MKRRHFVSAVIAAPVVAALSAAASAYDGTDYTREIYEAALASGEPFILDFTASW